SARCAGVIVLMVTPCRTLGMKNKFLDSLTPEQRAKATFDFKGDERVEELVRGGGHLLARDVGATGGGQGKCQERNEQCWFHPASEGQPRARINPRFPRPAPRLCGRAGRT